MMIPLPILMKKHGIKPTGVLHLGANLAQEAEMYHACGITKMIFVEALPDIYQQMCRNIEKYGGIGVNACVSDKVEKVTFHVANNEGQSSSFLDFGSHSKNHPTVKFTHDLTMTTERIDEMGLDLSGINFLCLDLQGVELRAMKGCGELLSQFDYIYSEVNKEEVYVGCDQIEEIDEYLGQFGFKRVETLFTGNGWGGCSMDQIKTGAFIVPFRDRDLHLRKFVRHYRRIMPEMPIYVIEQNDSKGFNRAKLFNVGFLEVGKNYDWCAYHDVDMELDTKRSDPKTTYAYPEKITHTATHLGQFNYNLAYPEFFGGVNLINREHMIEINGYTNLIYSWGLEDDAARENILDRGLEIERRETYYHSYPHPRKMDMPLFRENLHVRSLGRNDYIDGLTHCEYEVVSREDMGDYTLIKVNL